MQRGFARMFGKAVQDALTTADEVVTTLAVVRAAALQLGGGNGRKLE